jgi:disulfide bond formation protein DsbB
MKKMTDYSAPINSNDLNRAKTFYDIVCWGGLLIVLLPVGIANLILGYLLGDSPCTLCWAQRQQMAYIGVIALMMVRYGFKPKYLGMLLVMAAFGLYMSFRHLGNHAMRDVGQGFGLDVFGIHTQMWAEIVFWCVVMLFGLAVFLAPRFDALIAEMKGKPFRPLSRFNRGFHFGFQHLPGAVVYRSAAQLGSGRSGPFLLQSEVRYLV